MGKLTAALTDGRLPQSAELEKAVLGAILAGHKQLAELPDLLRPEDFFNEWQRKILVTILALQGDGQSTDLLAVHDVLERASSSAICDASSNLALLICIRS